MEKKATENKEYLLQICINNAKTGNLIEKFKIDLIDEDNEFENLDELGAYIDSNCNMFLELIDNKRRHLEFDGSDGVIYRIDIICLSDKKERYGEYDK